MMIRGAGASWLGGVFNAFGVAAALFAADELLDWKHRCFACWGAESLDMALVAACMQIAACGVMLLMGKGAFRAWERIWAPRNA